MRFTAFIYTDPDRVPGRRLGVEDGDRIADLTDGLGANLGAALATRGADGVTDHAHRALSDLDTTWVEANGVRRLAPLPRPGKIVCVGLNYHGHCREQGVEPPDYPMLFAKFANTITDPGAPVTRPRATERLDLECELAVILGRPASRVAPEHALDHVFGYTILNDITARDLQREDRQWLRAKGWDGFAPLGPVAVTRDEMGDPGGLAIRSWVNGEPWQDSTTADMIWEVATLIAFVSRTIHLDPGDVIATGTPAGVGHFHDPPRFLVGGDVMSCQIEGIGILENAVVDEQPRADDHAAAAGVEDA